jgi:hypothetical protein
MNKLKKNNITSNFYSDEWYTSQETVKLCYDLMKEHTLGTGIFPYDSEKSEFVKQCSTDKIYNIRDFIEGDYDYDYLITNPPFSIKDEVIEKIIADGKPACLILPLDSLGGVKRHALYKDAKIGAYIPTRRVNYYNEQGEFRKGASFHSILLFINCNFEGIKMECQLVGKNETN